MEKILLIEINNCRKLMNLEPLNEVADIYSNIDFMDGAVGNSKPSTDKINLSLLSDIQKACEIAGVKVRITTAVSGHNPGTRHEGGYAVDIAYFPDEKGNQKPIKGIDNAKKVGILNNINRFISALETLGYKKNVGEKGNNKVVLTFGFENHDNHIHVSNVTDRNVKNLKTNNQNTSVNIKVTPKKNIINNTSDIIKKPAGDPYEYKKSNNRYFYKLKTSNNWIDATGTKRESPIRKNVFFEN